MTEPISRRNFLHDTAAAAATLTAAAELASAADNGEPAAASASAGEAGFRSRWDLAPDRVWLGAEYWANPLQDWRIAGERIECIKAAPNRNVHLLTRQLSDSPGDFHSSIRIGRLGGEPLGSGKGTAGFRIGIQGPLREYRNGLIFGQGVDTGLTGSGRLFIGDLKTSVPVELTAASVELRLAVTAHGERSTVKLSAHDSDGHELARIQRDDIPSASLSGNVALVANATFSDGESNAKSVNKFVDKKPAAKSSPKGKAAGPTATAGVGEFWFADWRLGGSRVESHDDRAFGPILFNHYTLSTGILKMTAQMPPLGERDTQTVRLQVERDGEWTTIAEEPIHSEARTATFRVAAWDASRDVSYRLAYLQRAKNGADAEHYWPGTIRRDPVDQRVVTVADVSCNIHEAFPNVLYTANMARLNPDLLAFVGDQFYENSGGYGVQRAPVEPAILDYLRKWYMHGWTWRKLTRDRPSISIPDDHDVYQGNIWGESGAPQTGTQEHGGYNMPAAWVNVVHRTQTSHHPEPWDATPCEQGISVYSGPLVYGRVSFAILADRQFKSAPEGKVPATDGRADHVTDPNFDPKTADLPGLQLLGPGQMKHLSGWITDWRGAEMKAVISQTIFTAMATTHGGPGGRLVADYDTNGWPQSQRNAALREIRKAFAIHIAGDQHLPAVVHYGIDAHRDAGLAFAGPAVNTGYPRWFEPLKPGENRLAGAPDNTGDFRDCFGNPLTVLAVANGAKAPRTSSVLERLHDKVSGLGLVRFDKQERTITLECWPLLADPLQPGSQFPGWPVVCKVLDNYGRKAKLQLPRLSIRGIEQPVISVFEQQSGELVYGLRLAHGEWQPHIFAPGKYTVQISEPETGKSRELRDLEAQRDNMVTIEVVV